ncbi:Portal protein [Cleaved into: Protein B*] [Durusdinium trenchii]|uniref:Portal protein [Cleaved into: Protein B*] n=1 Tax=Durusdinium trenchii TaxID=1381693 RepID=A0ABP0HE67_9DINO
MPELGEFDAVIADPPYEANMHADRRGKKSYGARARIRQEGNANPDAVDFASIEPIRDDVAKLMTAASRSWVLAFCTSEGVYPWKLALEDAGAKYKRACVWVKPDSSPQFNGECPANGSESFVTAWAGEGRARWNGGGRRNVWTCPSRSASRTGEHPTEKPLSLMAELVGLFTNAGASILDPFMGSGTTGIAACDLGRAFVGIERDETYFDLACRRFEELAREPRLIADAQDALHELLTGKQTVTLSYDGRTVQYTKADEGSNPMTKAQLLDSSGNVIPYGTGARIRAASLSGTGGDASYRGASVRDAAVANWKPINISADMATLFDRDTVTARARDLIRNNGIARAAVIKQADMVVGRQFRLLSLPDHRALNLSREEASALGRQIEAAFRSWAEDPLRRCDRIRRHNFGGLVNLLYREDRSSGESLLVLRNHARPGWRWSTAVHAIDPDRLSNPHNFMDGHLLENGNRVRGGVELDPAGEAIAYHIRNAHELDVTFGTDTHTWTRVEKETEWGRPVCVHSFEPDRVEQTRGISPFASILAVFRMIDRHSQAEIASAVANALFIAFISSSYDPYSVQESFTTGDNPVDEGKTWQDLRTDIYKQAPINLGGNSIPVLAPGDEIQMNNAPRQTAEFSDFRSVFLQEVATALGMPYVALAERWDQVNYSSARAALNEVWRAVQSRRASFVEQTVNPVYFAIVEEAFARGYIEPPAGAPSFYENPAAYLRAIWVGPGRGYVDPENEAKGAALRVQNNFSTLEREAAEQGLDWEELLDQRAREVAELARLEIPAVAAGDINTPTDPPPAIDTETGGWFSRIRDTIVGTASTSSEDLEDAPFSAAYLADEDVLDVDEEGYIIADGVAILEIAGMLWDRSRWSYGRALWTYEGIEAAILAANADERVRAIMLRIESPGGLVEGMFDCAAQIRAVAQSGGGTKPVHAVIPGQATSAAYCLAAACDRVIAARGAGVASIGSIIVHVEFSKADDRYGVTVSPIRSRENKARQNSYEPLSDDAEAGLKEVVDLADAEFVEQLAGFRPSLTTASIDHLDGRMTVADPGARIDCVGIGLIDEIQSEREAFRALQALASGEDQAVGNTPVVTGEVNALANSEPTGSTGGKSQSNEEQIVMNREQMIAALGLSEEEAAKLTNAQLAAKITVALAASEEEEESASEEEEEETSSEEEEEETSSEEEEEEEEEEEAESTEASNSADSDRILAILDLKAAEGREKLARRLARLGLSVEDAKAALEDAAKANAGFPGKVPDPAIAGNSGNSTNSADTKADKLAEEAVLLGSEGVFARSVTILNGQTLLAGALLGAIALGAGSAVADGGNTGDGAFGAVTVGEAAIAGDYIVEIVEAATNAGRFSVIDPNGNRLDDGDVGTAYLNDHLGFTIADGAADFIVGDKWTVTVAAGSGKYLLSLAAADDGSQTPKAVLAEDCDASAGDKTAIVYFAGKNLMDIYSTTALAGVVRRLRVAQPVILNMFFPNMVVSDEEEIAFDVEIDKRRVSPFVSPLIAGKVVKSKGFRTDKFQPAYIKDKRIFDPTKPIRRAIGEQVGGDPNMSAAQREAANVALETQDQLEMLTMQEELMAIDAFLDGKTIVDGEGFDAVEVNFGRDAALTKELLGAARWGEDGVSPYDDVLDWRRTVRNKSGAPVTDIVFGETALDHFLADPKTEKVINTDYAGNTSVIDLAANVGEGAELQGKLGVTGPNLWSYSQTYTDDDDNEQDAFNPNAVVMGNRKLTEGTRSYGAIRDPKAGLQAMRYFSKSWDEEDPAVRWLMLQAAPLMVPTRINSTLGAMTRDD